MALSSKTRPFRYTFYLLAQNPFPSISASSSNNLKKCLLKLPVLMLICISLYVTLYSLKNDQYVTRKNKAREIIHVLLIISLSVTNLITVCQCLFLQKTWTELQASLGRLEKEFQETLPKYNVKFIKFRNSYLVKCSVMLILYLFSIFAMVMSRTTDQKFLTSYMVVLVLINDLSAFQIMFYVDLIRFFLKAMNRAFSDVIRRDLEKCANEKFVASHFMVSIKKLHFSVWNTVENVNEYFGLFLLGYIVQMFLMISYDIYWIFLNKFNVGVWLCMDNALVLICALLSSFFVSNSCDKIHEEAQKSTTLLYETNDFLALSESQHLLSQMLNKPINITAKGFYKLNRSFFAGLTVGSLTSAIMLVQFQTDE